MFDWFARAWRSDRPQPPPRAVRAVASVPVPVPAEDADAPPLLPWLVGAASRDTPLQAAERAALARLDTLVAGATAPAELVPRAPAVIPHLLSLLRHDAASLPALAQRVAKDLVLTAEVLRLARSPYYRVQREVRDLGQAVALLGERGLKAAIARVVLKPLLHAEPGALSARAAPLLWQHGEHKAMLCAAFAPDAGVDPLEAYLAGLVHNAGWTVALRELDRTPDLAPPFSAALDAALVERKDRLFGKVVAGWNLSRALSALGVDVLRRGLGRSRSPLAPLLSRADRLASQELARGA